MYSSHSTTFKMNNMKQNNHTSISTLTNNSTYEQDNYTNYSSNEIKITNYDLTEFIVNNWFYFKKTSYPCGGNQSSLYDEVRFQNIIREKIQGIIIKYFPDITYEQMTLIIERLGDVGCGYVAAVNAFFTTNPDLTSLSNILGFDLTYEGNLYADKSIDYEAMVLDFFLYYAVTVLNITNPEDIYNKEIILDHETRYEMIASGEPMSMNGGKPHEIGEIFVQYMHELGFDISLEKLFERPYSEDQTGSHDSDYNNQMFIKINECLEKGEPVVVGLEPLFKLETAEGNNVEMSNPEASHSVLVIGTTPDGKLIVTSWGRVYTVDMAYVYVAATYTY